MFTIFSSFSSTNYPYDAICQPFLMTSMPENTTDQPVGRFIPGPEAKMPAEFGLAMAIFVVVASMVGVGVSDDLRLHDGAGRKQRVHACALGRWRRDRGLRRLDARRAVRGFASHGWRLRLSLSRVWSSGGISFGLGFVSRRVFRDRRLVGIRLGQVPACTHGSRRQPGRRDSARGRDNRDPHLSVMHISGGNGPRGTGMGHGLEAGPAGAPDCCRPGGGLASSANLHDPRPVTAA